MVLTQEQKSQILNPTRKLPERRISGKYSNLRVLGLVADTSACGFYRIVNPLHLLKMHGADVTYGSHHSMDTFLKYDLIIAPRQHSEEVYELLKYVIWEGKTIIFEIDDDLDAVLPSSPAYMAYHPGSPELKMIHKVMRSCTGVTTTTQEMAKWCAQNTVNTAIIPNLIDFGFRDWGCDVTYDFHGNPTITPRPIQKPVEWQGKIVVGYSGGSTHGEDLKIMGPQISQLLKRNPDLHFALYIPPLQAEEFIQAYNLNRDQLTLVPARHFLDHPSGLHGIDISLAPLMVCQFNLAKSDLKAIESMAAGAAFIGSNAGPYARFDKKHPGLISLVGSAPGCYPNFTEAIEYLISNPEELERRQREGRQLIIDKYSLEKNIDLWPATWKTIENRSLKGIVGPPEFKSKEYYKSYGVTKKNDPCPCGQTNKTYENCCYGAWG